MKHDPELYITYIPGTGALLTPRGAQYFAGLESRLAASHDQVEEGRRALLMVLQSSLIDANGHDWEHCKQPSCLAAQAFLSRAKERQ